MARAAQNLLPLWEKDMKPYAEGIRRSWMRGVRGKASRGRADRLPLTQLHLTSLRSVRLRNPLPQGERGARGR